jgi:hypothetical protein
MITSLYGVGYQKNTKTQTHKIFFKIVTLNLVICQSPNTTRGGGLRKAPKRGQSDGCVTDTNSNIEAPRFGGKTISNDKNSNDQNLICSVLT